jgi:hypothetical protein
MPKPSSAAVGRARHAGIPASAEQVRSVSAHFEYFALHSLESIQLVDWNAACSQGSELMQKHLLTFIHTVALAR